MQTKKKSLIEVLVNTWWGFIISVLLYRYIVPYIDPSVQAWYGTAIWVTILFTTVSIARGYIVRRLFNKI